MATCKQGDVESAANVLSNCIERIEGTPTTGEQWHFGIMRAHYIIDSENWEAVDRWEMDSEKLGWGAIDYYFTNALAGIKTGALENARENLESLMSFMDIPERAEEVLHKSNQIKALLLIKEGDTEAGIEMLKSEIEYEFSLPIEFGPPEIVKPSSELLGEVYLEMEMMKEARAAFEAQLARTPERYLSVKGLSQVD